MATLGGMNIIKWVGALIDRINSWEEGIALSVMITVGGCTLILLIFLYSNLYRMFNTEPVHRRHSAPVYAVPAQAVRPAIPGHFGRPRDLDAHGNEARAAGSAGIYH